MSQYYVTAGAAGGGAGTSGDPFTLAESADNVVAGDKVWVKAGTYSDQDGATGAVLNISLTTATHSSPVTYEAYTTTIGDWSPVDGPIVILDANVNTLTNAMLMSGSVAWYHLFKGFRFTGGSGTGVDMGVTGDSCTWVGCRFDNNDSYGLQGDNLHLFYLCTADNNGAGGIDVDNDCYALVCKFHTNTGHGWLANAGIAVSCIAYANTNGQIRFTGSGGHIRCTVDGDDAAGTEGLHQSSSTSHPFFAINNIVMDCVIGILDAGNSGNGVDSDSINLSDYNDVVSCATSISQITQGVSDETANSDPFTNSATRDYTLAAASAPIDNGVDAGDLP